jgi:hypothetical protein
MNFTCIYIFYYYTLVLIFIISILLFICFIHLLINTLNIGKELENKFFME